jgi:hypothetical protein
VKGKVEVLDVILHGVVRGVVWCARMGSKAGK